MLRVGLTGSIAVGKSYVASVFEDLGCHVADADELAREAVAAGTPGLKAIVTWYVSGILQQDGTLNRAKLGAEVFADPAKREQLNAILHPVIFAAQDELLRDWEVQDPHGIGIVDASLMIESGGYKRFDKLVVVHCRPEIQLARLRERDHLSEADAQRRIASQLPQSEKIRYADFLIDTSAGLIETRRHAVEVYEKLRELARKRLR
jgi:dephospho-CoA kinase